MAERSCNPSVAWGEMREDSSGSPVSVVLTTQNQYYPWISVDSSHVDTPYVSFTADAVNGDYLEIMSEGDGHYRLSFAGAFSGSASQTYAGAIFVDAVETGIKIFRAIGTGGDVGAAGSLGILELTVGQKIRFKFKCTTAASKTCAIYVMHVLIERIGR